MEVAGINGMNSRIGDQNLILALNSGSSSLKFGLFRAGANDEEPVLSGSADGIGRKSGSFRIRGSNGNLLVQRNDILESQDDALAAIGEAISAHAQSTPTAVGHRVVHGGPRLRTHQIITPQVLGELRAVTHFAPLHIPQALKLIASAQANFPGAKQYACFDNAFHKTIPEVATHFPLPQRLFDLGIQRYGFHGLSYESLVHQLGSDLPQRAIFAHLGNGASLCALRNGISIDTTMGLTPTGGIPMGTRSGDLDPGVLIYLMRNEKLDADALEAMLNHESGLLGLSSGESDVKALEVRTRGNDPHAALALNIFAVSVRKMIGAYTALLGGVDLLVFAGGIGEHSDYVRSAATAGLEAIGLTKDKIRVLAAQEEIQIARHCRALL